MYRKQKTYVTQITYVRTNGKFKYYLDKLTEFRNTVTNNNTNKISLFAP